MKTAMISTRVSEDDKKELVKIAEQEGKVCSDVVKELIQGRIKMKKFGVSPRHPAVNGENAQAGDAPAESIASMTLRVSALLDQIHDMEFRRENLFEEIENKGGEPTGYSEGAPEHLRTALRICEANLKGLNEEMKALLEEIETNFGPFDDAASNSERSENDGEPPEQAEGKPGREQTQQPAKETGSQWF